MRIGLFTDTYPPFINGVSTSVFMLKQALEKLGHEVYVVTISAEGFQYDYNEDEKLVRVPGIPIGIYDYRVSGVYPVRVVNKIKKWNLDIIHSHTEFSMGTFARIVAKQYNIPLVHTYHTMYEDYIHYITKGYFDKSSKKIVEYLSLFYCDKTATELVVPTKKTYDLFKQKYKVDRNIHIVPTGIEVERFFPENVDKEKVAALRKELGLAKKDFVYLFVGRLAEEKNVEFLLEASKKLVAKDKNFKFIIVGDGPDIDKYKNFAKENRLDKNIIFTGKVPWEDVPLYYQLANIFTTASITETQGLTVIEAMAAGVPPICIDDESFRNVVIDGVNGRLFKTEEEFLEIVFDLIKDKDRLSIMKKQARINGEHYSSKYYAESILDVYDYAIKRQKNNKPFYIKIGDKIKGMFE